MDIEGADQPLIGLVDRAQDHRQRVGAEDLRQALAEQGDGVLAAGRIAGLRQPFQQTQMGVEIGRRVLASQRILRLQAAPQLAQERAARLREGVAAEQPVQGSAAFGEFALRLVGSPQQVDNGLEVLAQRLALADQLAQRHLAVDDVGDQAVDDDDDVGTAGRIGEQQQLVEFLAPGLAVGQIDGDRRVDGEVGDLAAIGLLRLALRRDEFVEGVGVDRRRRLGLEPRRGVADGRVDTAVELAQPLLDVLVRRLGLRHGGLLRRRLVGCAHIHVLLLQCHRVQQLGRGHLDVIEKLACQASDRALGAWRVEVRRLAADRRSRARRGGRFALLILRHQTTFAAPEREVGLALRLHPRAG